MITCKKCGTEILEGTDAAEDQICIPCKDNRPLFYDAPRNIRHFRKRLASFIVHITRLSHTKLHADYSVTATLWDNDPRFRSQSIITGTSTGILRIEKQTGHITVVYPLAFDNNDKIISMAKSFLSNHYTKGEFPKETGWAMS